MKTKPWLSKTLWTNLILCILSMLPATKDHVSSNPGTAMFIVGGINIALRLVTHSQISLED